MLGRGSWEYVLDRPIALTIFTIAFIVAILPMFGFVRKGLKQARAVNEL